MRASRPPDEDRLPWLEPYREKKASGKALPRRGYGKPIGYGVALALVLAVGAGGYWLGQREDAPSRPTQTATVALPAPKPSARGKRPNSVHSVVMRIGRRRTRPASSSAGSSASPSVSMR